MVCSHVFYKAFLFCRAWIAFVSFRKVRGLMTFFPFLKFRIAHSATLDRRERSFVENCFACARISSRYFSSTTLLYSRHVSSAGSSAPAAGNIDRSTPPAQRVDASFPIKWNSPATMCLRTRRPTVLLVHTPPLGAQNLLSTLDRMRLISSSIVLRGSQPGGFGNFDEYLS